MQLENRIKKIHGFLTGMEGYGVGRTTREMADELKRRGVEVRYLAVQPGPITDLLQGEGLRVDLIPNRADGKWTASGLGASIRSARKVVGTERDLARAAGAMVREYDPDWLHLRSSRLLLMVGLVARSCGKRAYWHMPSTINRKLPMNLQAFAYQAFCRATSILPLANSEHTARSLNGALVKARVMYPGVDPRRFDQQGGVNAVTRADLGIGPSSVVFGSLARLVPEKAHHLVIEAFARLVREGVDGHLIIAGGPLNSAYGKQLQGLASQLKVSARVSFVGEVEDPRPYYNLSDVIVSGRLDPEPFGLTIVEAMLMKRPVIAFKEGGPSESIRHGETGWLIEMPTLEGYIATMKGALEERPRWAEMGIRARTRAIENFTVERTVDDYLNYAGQDER